jgi:hypothetical protein
MHTLIERPALILQCPNCAGDCEPVLPGSAPILYLCGECAHLCRLHPPRKMLDSLTANEIRDLHGLWAWKYIEQEQAVIRIRATTIPPVEFRPAVLYGDPPAPQGEGWKPAKGMERFLLAAIACVCLVTWWRW